MPIGLNRITRSFAFRSGPVYQKLAAMNKFSDLPSKPVDDRLLLLTMVGHLHLAFLRYSLLSIYKTWGTLPAVRIVSDGSVGISQIVSEVRWWPGDLEVVDHNHCLPKDLYKFSHLQSYFQGHPFGKKFAVVLGSAVERLTLWCDVDILWHGDLLHDILQRGTSSGDVICVASDYQPAYDYKIEGATALAAKGIALNAGVVLARGNPIDLRKVDKLLEKAGPIRDSHFTEQTLFALACYESGNLPWSQEQICCTDLDKFRIIPNIFDRGYAARHYVGPVRHLFWLDAYYNWLFDTW